MFIAMNSVNLKNSVDAGLDGEDSGYSEMVTRFCMPLCSRDSQVREIALETMGKTVEGWLDGYGSPKHHCPQTNQNQMSSSPPGGASCAIPSNGHCVDEVDGVGDSGATNGNVKIVPKEYLDLVMIHLPAVLRLSINCPFTDVRVKCGTILKLVEERGVPVPKPTVHGPSAYIPPEELPPLGTHNEQTHMLFIDAFLQNNRLDHVTQVIGYHPTYLDVFLRTQNFILRGDGPLPYDYRHFIAIMAAGRHQCSYLINLQKQEFLLQGGDQTWLKGLSQIPQKLRDLYEINKILAHRPWLLNKSHIEKLTKGKDSWSLAEVVHAIVLLAHFHSLSSFVFGCGVNEEVDRAILASPTSDNSAASGGRSSPTSPTANSEPIVNSTSSSSATASQDASSTSLRVSPHSASSQYSVGSPSSHNGEVLVVSGNACSGELEAVGVETLMQRMKSLSERAEEFSAEERTKRFEHVESQSAELLLSPAGMNSTTQVKADIGQFVDDPTFLYQDFARRGEMGDIPTFRVQDYSWDDHGYSLVNRLYNDVGNLLDEKFKTAYNLTYYTMGGRKDVDTSRFRRAIWNYIQCMFGIRHDDYDYGEVNQLLERSLKAFIKSACCFPERVTKKDYDSVLREFKHSEKVHVNLMVLEARMQAELLYALRAVMRYMT